MLFELTLNSIWQRRKPASQEQLCRPPLHLPPYASNAIDYMRAHKFSLVWFDYSIDKLMQKRKEYIGGEDLAGARPEHLPANTVSIVQGLHRLDPKKLRFSKDTILR